MTTQRVLVLAVWFLLLTILPAASHGAELRGSWTATPQDDGVINWQFVRPHNQHGHSMPLNEFTGLTEAQIASAAQTPVQFELRRDAGVLSMEGVFRNREGAGHFIFRPNARYFDQLQALGVTLDRDDRKDEDSLFTLAMTDVSPEFIRSMQAAGYRGSVDQYVSMRIFRVTPQLLDELRSLGYGTLDFDDLIASRVHRVTPEYIRQMRAAGYPKLSMDDLVATRIHQATPDFLGKMKDLGYHLAIDDAVAFRIHRVTPEFIASLRDLGYTNIAADDLVAMRIHRVTPEFIRELKNVGYSGIPVSKLIDMRIHGIDASYIAKVK